MNAKGMKMAEWWIESRRRIMPGHPSVIWISRRERREIATLLWGEIADDRNLLSLRGLPVVIIDEPPKVPT